MTLTPSISLEKRAQLSLETGESGEGNTPLPHQGGTQKEAKQWGSIRVQGFNAYGATNIDDAVWRYNQTSSEDQKDPREYRPADVLACTTPLTKPKGS